MSGDLGPLLESFKVATLEDTAECLGGVAPEELTKLKGAESESATNLGPLLESSKVATLEDTAECIAGVAPEELKKLKGAESEPVTDNVTGVAPEELKKLQGAESEPVTGSGPLLESLKVATLEDTAECLAGVAPEELKKLKGVESEPAKPEFISGQLSKLSPGVHRFLAFAGTYQVRHVVLTQDDVLTWFLPTDKENGRGSLKLSSNPCIVEPDSTSETRFIIRPVGKWDDASFTRASDGRPLTFDARESEHTRERWIEVIQERAKSYKDIRRTIAEVSPSDQGALSVLRGGFLSVSGLFGKLGLEDPANIGRDVSSENRAFVFIKPHAQTIAVRELVEKKLTEKGISILSQGEIGGEKIDADKLIDQHYYAIASKATILSPDQLSVPADKFEEKFGESWDSVLAAGKAVNALKACEEFGLSAEQLGAEWKKCDPCKFGGGFYCGKMTVGGKTKYVFNAFFMSMRAKFTSKGASIYYYSVSWDAAALSWQDFRGSVLGPTNPSDAPPGAIRGEILSDWQSLGLSKEPDVSDNGLHASASPFEGLCERMNWLGIQPDSDPFGASLLASGISKEQIIAWSIDPAVTLVDGSKGSVFDTLEDMDAAACAERLARLAERRE